MLSTAQKAAFATQGFVPVRQTGPEALVSAAKAKINDALASDRSIGRPPCHVANSFCPGSDRRWKISAIDRFARGAVRPAGLGTM
jgi:hypothetical protein